MRISFWPALERQQEQHRLPLDLLVASAVSPLSSSILQHPPGSQASTPADLKNKLIWKRTNKLIAMMVDKNVEGSSEPDACPRSARKNRNATRVDPSILPPVYRPASPFLSRLEHSWSIQKDPPIWKVSFESPPQLLQITIDQFNRFLIATELGFTRKRKR